MLALSLGLAFGMTGGATAGLALGTASGVILGISGAIFDRLRRPAMGLSAWGYWGRALAGVIWVTIGVALFGFLLGFMVTLAEPFLTGILGFVEIGLLFGLIGALLLLVTLGLGLRLELGRIEWRRLRWHLVDTLLLGLIGGAVGGLLIGVGGGLTGAVALIALWGVLTGVGGGAAMQVGNGLSAALVAAGLTWLLVAGPASFFGPTALLAVATTLLLGLYSYVRFPICMVEIPLTRWQYWQARRRPAGVFTQLQRTPVYWDDLIFYPLPALDQFLLLALRADRDKGLSEVAFIAQSFRQGWAANRARLIFAAETLAGCASPAAIAAAPAELDWLADEVMQQLGASAGEVIPRLAAIANGVRSTLEADNLYARRLGYREALDNLDTLHRRLPSLGEPVVRLWQPVIGQWQQVLLNELEAVATVPTTTIENPYQPGNPLQLNRRDLFKGRRELRDVVVKALLERHRPTLVLHGPRRMGKTSFLLQLPALLPGNTLPVFLDLQRPAATQTTAAFLYHIARAISRDARPYRLAIDSPQRDNFTASPFEAFAVWLEDVALPALRDFNLLLTFDEFEKLGEAVEAGRLEVQIFDELRYLIQHQSRLALLFAGVQTLDELGPAWSSYFINIKPVAIDYLQAQEAEELIRCPDPQANFSLIYDDPVVEAMIGQTAGHPYLLQLLCSAVVDECNAQATHHVDPGLLEAALPRAFDQGEPYFRNIWDEMAGPAGQPLLRRLALAPTPLALPASPALAHLVRRRVVTQRDGRYSVEVPLVRRWLAERAPL